MKVIVKAPFFDGTIHKKGDIVEVNEFNPVLMDPYIEEEKTKKIVETATKKEPKKTTRKKV